MADELDGKLHFKGEGKNRKRFLSFTTTKGKPMEIPINPNLFSPSLRASEEAEIAVKLQVGADGRPTKIYIEGETWKEETPSPVSRHQVAANNSQPNRNDWRGHRRNREDTREERNVVSPVLPGKFYNPYNFIPALPRQDVNNELGDHAPAGHDRYQDELYSGVLKVKLTVKTPLLLPDTARATVSGEGKELHRSFPLRRDADGNLYLAPTSLKGMLRSAYEAITNSRLSIFHRHNKRLAFRMETEDALRLKPAIVVKEGDNLCLRVLVKAAKLDRYEKSANGAIDKGEGKAALRYGSRSGAMPQHGESVAVQLDSKNWVRKIERYNQSKHNNKDWRRGWVFVTGANISIKRFERVFIEGSNDRKILVTEDLKNLWKELILNYKKEHDADLKGRKANQEKPTDYLGDEPGQTAWSQHVHIDESEDLSKDTLCYLQFDVNGNIKAILPVSVSRQLHKCRPEDLLLPELHPAKHIDYLSPADRVFGWVNRNGSGAHRGQLRIANVRCAKEVTKQFDGGLPLAILGQPKPQQGRFYVARNERGKAQRRGLSNEEAGYQEGKGLRGRKVYPHHAKALATSDYWTQTPDYSQLRVEGDVFREYARPEGKRDKQNRSMQEWVDVGAEFTLDIHVTNLSKVELGALLWLLKLPGDHFHRLGGGKPLGFGSVRLDLDGEQCGMGTGASWKERYRELNEKDFAPLDADDCTKAFRADVLAVPSYNQTAVARESESDEDVFQRVSFIAAFLKAAKGFDNKPTHYPRVWDDEKSQHPRPNPEGESFKWFVANNKPDNRFTLSDLATDEGLPLLDPPKEVLR